MAFPVRSTRQTCPSALGLGKTTSGRSVDLCERKTSDVFDGGMHSWAVDGGGLGSVVSGKALPGKDSGSIAFRSKSMLDEGIDSDTTIFD